jgi:predicted negative regulator of RcsB-dependent stress response
MGNPGWVYVLVNQSLNDCVKIGKTTTEPTIRASEISSATGVPTPFIVAYEAYFNDCDSAESYVHTLLESRGVRLSPTREFFSISSTVAINAICEAHQHFIIPPSDTPSSGRSDKLSNGCDLPKETLKSARTEQKHWESIVEEAENYEHGRGDFIKDHERAIKMYKKAAKLGSLLAYIRLAELVADSENDADEGIKWLKLGAENGFPDCWRELANVYCFKNDRYRFSYHGYAHAKENAIKSYRNYLKHVDSPLLKNSIEEMDKMLASFSKYVELVSEEKAARDVEASRVFVSKFRNIMTGLGDRDDVKDRLLAIGSIVKKYSFI